MNLLEEAKRVLEVEAGAVKALARRLGPEFVRAVDLIHGSKGRVIVSGMGKSGLVGKKIAATLASTGTPSFFLHPAEASHGDLGMVTSEDIVLAISNSGETDELVGLLPFLKRFGVRLVAMTGNAKSAISKASDVHIDISVKEEACPMGIVPTASTTAALAMGDALAVALLLKKGFKAEDFAQYHPKGSLGKKLLVKVSDLMHRGDALPRVGPDTPIAKAVVEMSSKRLGMTAVVDRRGRIMGVISDGDIRRGIERWGSRFFEMQAGEVMTRTPKTIEADALAAKALAVMEAHSITALLVPGGGGKLDGIVHIHDILKEGIA